MLVTLGSFAGAGAAHAATPFAPTSVWNAPLARKAPLDARSKALVAELRHQLSTTAPWIATTEYSSPIYTVPAGQATVPVVVDGHSAMFTNYDDQWNLTNIQLKAVPLPVDVHAAGGTDGHVVVYQPSTDTLWELWQLRLQTDLKWHASWGGRITEVSQSPGYFQPGQFGATATGLSLLGGMIRTDELKAGHIDHALSFAVPHPLWHTIWSAPAQRSDGDNTDLHALPEGIRFRLDPALDIPALHLEPATEAIALAVQKYGMVLSDKGGCVCFYAEDPSPTASNPYPGLFGTDRPDVMLASFPWDRLQALKLSLNQPIPWPHKAKPAKKRRPRAKCRAKRPSGRSRAARAPRSHPRSGRRCGRSG